MQTPALDWPISQTAGRTSEKRGGRVAKAFPLYLAGLLTVAAPLGGCTSFTDYVHNGLKVGPNYCRPPAPVAKDWIDSAEVRVKKDSEDLSKWWQVFKDPVLNSLIVNAYQQNLTLREAGTRILQARAQLGIAVGNFFPQTQQMRGDYTWNAISAEVANRNLQSGTLTAGQLKRFYGQWDYGFSLAWELDFWGLYRRAIESSRASLDASVESYDAALVTLLGDVATYYVQVRTYQQRIEYARANVRLLRDTLRIAQGRYKAGTTGELDVDQAQSTLAQTEATIPAFEISLRQANNQLCVLLGIPPEDLQPKLGKAPIPTAPAAVAAGVPMELLRRRPDVRQAERQAAAQSAEIGVAESALYPHISIASPTNPLTFGWSAEFFKDLFKSAAFTGSIGPTFTWNNLNYGRLLNNVHAQEASYQNLVATYQNTVLTAQQDVENGLVTFLQAQEQTRFQAENVKYAERAVRIGLAQYEAGTIDFTRLTQLEQALISAEDLLAQAQGEIALGLIQVYRALGGGWELGHPKETSHEAAPVAGAVPGQAPAPAEVEQLPMPRTLPETR